MGKERCNVARCPLAYKSERTKRQTPLQVFTAAALALRDSYLISQLVGDFRYLRERNVNDRRHSVECFGCKKRNAVRIYE